MKKTLSLILLFLFTFSFSTFAQTAKINTFSVSAYMVTHDGYPVEYSGLKTVGIGELVYLKSNASATAYTWEITSKPATSVAVLDSTTKQMTTFRPDVKGDYKIKLTIGTTTDEITIVAGTYVGAITGNCGLCHAGTATELAGTGHATILKRGVDGILSGHYGESCIKCHTVGYNKDVTAVNGGFDDVQKELGWIFPVGADQKVGNFDAMDAKLKNVSNIQCENCHGPASQHMAGFDKTKMAVTLDSGMCAKCHDDGHYHRRPSMWANSAHARSAANSASTRSGCNDCHSGSRFVELVDTTPGIKYDSKNTGAIGCAVCHDPHASHDKHDPAINREGAGQIPLAEQAHNLRTLADVTLANGEVVTFGGQGKLCMNCHKSRRDANSYVNTSAVSSHFGPHHSTQTDMILGTNAITFGRYIPSSTHRDVMPDFCVTCHMAPTPADGPGHDKLGDHSFAMHYDNGTAEDTTDDVYNVAICQSCHGANIKNYDSFIARADYDADGKIETAREELHGLLLAVEEFFPKTATGSFDYTPSKWNTIQTRALFNHAYVEEDYSGGMHNYQFAVGLLKVTLEALNYGTLVKGQILNVTDVPNDQGKQVHVVWTRFGGDGASDNPVKDYMLLRKDAVGLAKAATQFNSFKDVPGDLKGVEIGSKIKDNHEVWTIVGRYAAAQLFEYAVVAPTLYDSTAAGMMETSFKVVGVTANGITAETDEAKGYSMDNLAPMAPTGFMGTLSVNQIKLDWDDAVDEDFKYFAIYKSTVENFDPAQTAPFKTTIETSYVDMDVQQGTKYFYTVAAVDFSGNVGEYAQKIGVFVTGVEAEFGTPTNFSLMQNYPNPFNPTTSIKFGIPEQAEVKVTIYDAVGRVVGVIVNETLPAGYYNYSWNATNLASGVYFYEMQAGNFRQTNKMLLMK